MNVLSPWIALLKGLVETTIQTANASIEHDKKHILIHISNMTRLKKWTNNDSFLMERASSLISGKEIAIFNKVRMHLKVATFSDILTADRLRVDASKIKGEYKSTGPNPNRDAYEWPIVPLPTATEKRIWTETICTMYGVTQNNRIA